MSPTELMATGLGLYALAAAVDLLAGVRRRWLRPLPYLAAAAGAGFLLALGVLGMTGHPVSFGPDLLATTHAPWRLDQLAGLFLTLTSAVALGVALAFAGWVQIPRALPGRGLGAGFALLLAAVAGTLLARDAFDFLFAYELITVAFFILTSLPPPRRARVPANVVTAVFAKGSGALLLLGFLLLAGAARSLDLAAWAHVGPSDLRDGAWVLIVAGFATKVGLIPVHVWMPSGYPAAPGPAKAAMSAIAANAGIYGLWRLLAILGPPPEALATAVLVLGGLTALLGIAHAAVQPDLDRALAYSSLENGGIILTGFGVAMVGDVVHSAPLLALGLLAATLQACAHSFAKATLFAAGATLTTAAGSSDLEDVRGTGRALPVSGTAFAVGALTLAALPPTLGFASEWFILEALLQQFRVHALALALAMALAAALLALTAGFAVLVFLRLLGLCVLTRRGARHLEHPRETGWFGRLGLGLLSLGCLLPAALAPLLVRFLATGLAPDVPARVTRASLSGPWVLTAGYAGFSVLSPSWLWITLPTALLALLGLVVAVTRGRFLRPRRVPAWHSATPGVSGPDSYTSLAFATPARHVLANVLHPHRRLSEAQADDGSHVVYEADVVEIIEELLYRPLARVGRAAVGAVGKVQSGRLDAYVSYILVVVLAVLIAAAALGHR